MIRLTDLSGNGSFTMGGKKFEYGKVYSNPYATAFKPVNEAEESEDHEVSMAQNQLDSIIKSATELKQKMGEEEKQIPAWIQDHITNSENYISQAASNYHEYGDSNEQVNEDREADIIRDMERSVKNLQYLLTKAKHPKEKENLKANIAATISTINWSKNKSKYESVNEDIKLRDGKYEFSTKSGVATLKFNGEEIASGDFDRGADAYFISHSSWKGQKAFNDGKEVIAFFKKNRIVVEAGPCWKGYKQVGMKTKNGKEVPNCVPESVMSEASVAKLQKDYSKVVELIQQHLQKYKASKNDAEKKKHVEDLKKLNITKKKIEADMDKTISGLYKDAELKEDCGCK